MNECLLSAMKTVLRDVRASRAPEPIIDDKEWSDIPGQCSAVLVDTDGRSAGVSVMVGESRAQQVATVADQIQEWVIEALWFRGAGSTWPLCPFHPQTHPLNPVVSDDKAVWSCPELGRNVASIGELAERVD